MSHQHCPEVHSSASLTLPLAVRLLLHRIQQVPYILGQSFPGILCHTSTRASRFILIQTCVSGTVCASVLSVVEGLPPMAPSERLEPADSGALGCDAVLRRVQDPFLASIFWLALGCVLWGPDKTCMVKRPTLESTDTRARQPHVREKGQADRRPSSFLS